jgi:pimeloyl-ACP methyl ester carboxylesterase
MPGHGRSAHLSAESYYASAAYAAHVVEAWVAWRAAFVDAAGDPPCVLVGHSLGASVSSVAAAVLAAGGGGGAPRALVLIDGLGPPMPRGADSCVAAMARAVEAKRDLLGAAPSTYASADEAAAHRMATAARNPGKLWISAAAARALVDRALVAAPGGGVRFAHDPKIKGPSPHYFSEEQAHEILGAIACPVLLVLASDGWPRPADVMQARARCVRDLETRTLPGSHHLHADPDTAPAVAAAVLAFLRARGVLLPATN